MLPRITFGGELMFKTLKQALRLIQRARYLTRVASECEDHEELRRIALAVMRGKGAVMAPGVSQVGQGEEWRRLAA